jgi:NAD(P)-dependent dehydrogenase (short-subunit alcohol dehydrogenase family)
MPSLAKTFPRASGSSLSAPVDHVVSTASAHARGQVADLDRDAIRVNAISPGVIDTGASDALGEQGKADYFAELRARSPARRIGAPRTSPRASCSP